MSANKLSENDDEVAPSAPAWRAWARSVRSWPAARLGEERARWGLWFPVGLGLGIAVYFALPFEPPPWIGALVLAALAAGMITASRHPEALIALAVLAAPTLGFTASQVRTAIVDAPQLVRPLAATTVTGRVALVERLEEGVRVTLSVPIIDKLPPERTPRAVRLRFAASLPAPEPGTLVKLRASLLPPPAPAEPGAYDFQQAAFFAGIGAVGYAFGPADVLDPTPDGPAAGFFAAVDRLRGSIAARVRAVAGGSAAPVTIALLNGEQTGISHPVMDAMRASGLAHLLSISGLHIALVAGIVFFAARALLALIETAALNWPIKKIAAMTGMAAVVGYTLVVGAPVPTLRSVLMTGMVMLAVIFDRAPFSPRVFAAAATAILLSAPESMLGPSFQMSFGAVAALIAAYEAAEPVLSRRRRGFGPVGRIVLNGASLAFSSVVASAATAPFALYHFQNVTFYGVLANMLAVPLTSFWVMPWGLIAYLLMPFGLEGWALVAMNWGSAGVVGIAETVAGWPGAVALAPAMPDWGLAAVAFGGVWLCFWRKRWRLLGVPLVLAGLASPVFANRPDALVSGDGRLMAVRGADGVLSLSSARGSRIVAETWIRRDGSETPAAPWPAHGSGAGGLLTCDPLGCLYRKSGQTIAFVRDPMALDEDCRQASAVISAENAPRCHAHAVIDGRALSRSGAHALYASTRGIRIERVRSHPGNRPWSGGR